MENATPAENWTADALLARAAAELEAAAMMAAQLAGLDPALLELGLGEIPDPPPLPDLPPLPWGCELLGALPELPWLATGSADLLGDPPDPLRQQ